MHNPDKSGVAFTEIFPTFPFMCPTVPLVASEEAQWTRSLVDTVWNPLE